jgi:Bacterial PH domain
MPDRPGSSPRRQREQRYLAEGENIALSVRRHWTMFLRSGVQSLGVLVGAFVLDSLTSNPSGAGALDPLWAFASVGAVLFFVWQVLNWWMTTLVVTDHRVFEVTGLLTRNVASMPLAKMTDITYHQSLLGRLLRYGELILESAGQEQALSRITHLPDPLNFYRTVTLLVTKAGLGRPRGSEDEEGVAARGVPEELFEDDDAQDDDDTDESGAVTTENHGELGSK